MCINRLTIFFYPNPPPVAVRNGENNLPTLECVTRVCNKNGDTKPLNICTIGTIFFQCCISNNYDDNYCYCNLYYCIIEGINYCLFVAGKAIQISAWHDK